MGLLSRLQTDMVSAMKARESLKLDALRYLISQIKYVQIDQGELADSKVEQLIAKEVKQGEEAVDQFKQGGRSDLVDQENQKLAIWRSYLPQFLTDSELDAIIAQVLAEQEKPDFGSSMKVVMSQVGTRANGQQVASRLKTALSLLT